MLKAYVDCPHFCVEGFLHRSYKCIPWDITGSDIHMVSETQRNYALDYFRVIALAMMAYAHFTYYFLSYEFGSWERFFRDVTEVAPAVFFIAFGMTMLHNAGKPTRWRSFFELGIISLLHQVYVYKTDVTLPNFLLFLWFMYFIVLILRPLFANRWFRVVLAVAIILVNLIIGHEKLGYFGEYPFGIMPWAFYVIIGISLGIGKPDRPAMLRLLVAGLAMVALGFIIPSVSTHMGINLRLGGITKWQPTTSAYLLLTAGLSMLVYWALNQVKYSPQNVFNYRIIFVSKLLLLGTVAHYFTNLFVCHIIWLSGYSSDVRFPIPLLIVTLAMISGGLYAFMLILADLRSLVLKRWLDEKALYRLGWIISIVLLIISIPLFIKYKNNELVQFCSLFGMIFAGWIFMRLKKDEIVPL